MKKELIYEGKAKNLFSTNDENKIIQHFKDDVSAFNGWRHDILEGKGIFNNLISENIMCKLRDAEFPTHFVKRLNEREQLVLKTDVMPIEVIIRNKASGSLIKRYSGDKINIKEGMELNPPLIEYNLKEDLLEDPLIYKDHIMSFNLATEKEMNIIFDYAFQLNDFLKILFDKINLDLVDIKLEFGRYKTDIYLIDEISPDNCRLWDKKTGKKMDKDIFRENRDNLSNMMESYKEIANRMGINYESHC